MAQYTISAIINPEGTGTVEGIGTYEEYTAISLFARAAEGYTFLRWGDGGTSNPRDLLVTEDITFTAEFVPEGACVLTIGYNADQGTVTGAGTYTTGTSVTINATPISPYVFQHWEDRNAGNIFAFETPYTFTITTHLNLNAIFQIPTTYYTIAVKSEQPDMGRVVVSGATSFGTDSEGYTLYSAAAGNQVRLSGSANTGYRFVRWSDGTTDLQYNFIATENLTISASFEENPIIPEAGTVLQLSSDQAEVNVGLTGTLNGTFPISELTWDREFYWSVNQFDALDGASSTVYTWTPSTLTNELVRLPINDSFENLLANMNSSVFYLGAVARNDQAIIYQNNIPFTVTVNAAYKPTISLYALTLSDTYHNYPIAGYSSYVTRYISGVAPSNNSATVIDVQAQANKGYCSMSGSILHGIVGTLVGSDDDYNFYITATATDTRGRTNSGNSPQIEVLGYHLPYFSLIHVEHCDEHGISHEGEEADGDTYVKVVFDLNVDNVLDNTVTLNTIGVTVDHRTYYTVQESSEGLEAIVGGGQLNPKSNYSVTIEVFDKIMSELSITPETFTVSLSTKFPISLLDDREGAVGAAFGIEASQDDIIEMALDTSFRNDILLKGNATFGSKVRKAEMSSYDLIHNAVRAWEDDRYDANDEDGNYANIIRTMSGQDYKKLKDDDKLDEHTLYFLSSPVTGV